MAYKGTERIDAFFAHHGIKGQKWGLRRYQNPDGSLTEAGKKRYSYGYDSDYKDGALRRKARKADEKTVKDLEKTYTTMQKAINKSDKKGKDFSKNKYYIKASWEAQDIIDSYIKEHGSIRLEDVLGKASSKVLSKDQTHSRIYEELNRQRKERSDKAMEEQHAYQFFGPSQYTPERYKEGIKEARALTNDKELQNILSDDYKAPPKKAVDNFFKGIKTKAQLDKKINNLDAEALFDNSYTSNKKEKALEDKIRKIDDAFLREALINQRMNYDFLELTDEIYKRASELRKTLKD